MAQDSRRFNWRAFFSLYIVLSFVVIAATGVVLYMTPPGRVANWSEWTFAGLTKEQWQAVHTIFTFAFVVAAGFHVYFNWKILLAYLRHRFHAGIPRWRELAASSSIVIGLMALTLGDMPPLSYVIDARETIAASWSTPLTEPPVPHAELLTLAKLGETIKMPVEKIQAKLTQAQIDASGPDATLGEIAERHGLKPSELYAKIREGEAKTAIPIAEGGGYGQKTVRQVSDQLQMSVDDVLENLRRRGVEAGPDDNVKALAGRHGKLPIEVVKMMQGETEP
jgi:hypothetical protein